MATNFPTSLDSFATLVDGTDYPKAEHPNDRGDAIEALETKVGVDSSTVTGSHDYKIAALDVLTTIGDLIVEGASVPERLAGGVAGTILKGKGAGVLPAYEDKTHKLFIQAWHPGASWGTHGVRINNVGDSGLATIMIPDTYLRDAKIEIIYVPNETGANMHTTISGYRQKEGETNWTDTFILLAQDIGATVDGKMYSYDVTAQFSAIRGGDLILISVAYNDTAVDTNLDFSGVRIEYVSS